MAYHFRRLKQTLRIIPSTKSIGFSTRVNEGDQTKNQSPIDGRPVNTHIDGSPVRAQGKGHTDQTVAILDEGLASSVVPTACTVLPTACTVLGLPSDSDLLYHLQPFLQVRTLSLPVAYKDIVQVLLPRISDEGFFEDKDPVFSIAKSVGFTSDDILVHFADSFSDSNTTISTREQIPIDILTQHYCQRLAHETVRLSHDLPNSDNVVESENDTRTVTTGSSDNQGLMHVYYSANSGANSRPKGNSKDGPSPEQMQEAKEKLEEMVIHLFKGSHNYEMLHKNVVMENNLFGDNNISVGLTGYKLELLKLRLRIYTKLFSTSMEILSVTALEQNGVIRIHWRLKGLPQIQNLKFWRVFQSHQAINKEDWEWLEAFSYFHLGKDGLVHKHRIDRMMPDDNQPDLTEKLRGLLNPAKPLVN